MNIIITDTAMNDIRRIHDYFYYNLQNSAAAEAFTKKIFLSCNRLSLYPNIGMSLKEKTGKNTDYRYLICGNYIAFYKVTADTVRVERIADGRTDYMKAIF